MMYLLARRQNEQALCNRWPRYELQWPPKKVPKLKIKLTKFSHVQTGECHQCGDIAVAMQPFESLRPAQGKSQKTEADFTCFAIPS